MPTVDLSKIIVELRYKEPAFPFTFRSSIYKKVTGSPPSKEPNIQEGINIRIKDRAAQLLIEPQKWGVDIERVGDVAETQLYLLGLFSRLYNAISWKVGRRIGVRTMWLHKFDGTMAELTSRLKQKNFTDQPIINESTDVAFPLTLSHQGNRINFNLGPVTDEELRNRFFNTQDLDFPSVGLLVDIDYIFLKEGEFNKGLFKKVLNEAVEYARGKAEQSIQNFL